MSFICFPISSLLEYEYKHVSEVKKYYPDLNILRENRVDPDEIIYDKSYSETTESVADKTSSQTLQGVLSTIEEEQAVIFLLSYDLCIFFKNLSLRIKKQ